MFAGLFKVSTETDNTILSGMCSKENEIVIFDNPI